VDRSLKVTGSLELRHDMPIKHDFVGMYMYMYLGMY